VPQPLVTVVRASQPGVSTVERRCAHARSSATAKPEAQLNATRVATMVEAAFVPAVMAVSTSGDVTELKLFIAAAMAGCERGYDLDALGDEMSALPVQTAGRPLAPEEEALRRLWMALVYLAREQVRRGHEPPRWYCSSDDDALAECGARAPPHPPG
jgi:hypothetical protein